MALLLAPPGRAPVEHRNRLPANADRSAVSSQGYLSARRGFASSWARSMLSRLPPNSRSDRRCLASASTRPLRRSQSLVTKAETGERRLDVLKAGPTSSSHAIAAEDLAPIALVRPRASTNATSAVAAPPAGARYGVP
jgi:hypothetical protein